MSTAKSRHFPEVSKFCTCEFDDPHGTRCHNLLLSFPTDPKSLRAKTSPRPAPKPAGAPEFLQPSIHTPRTAATGLHNPLVQQMDAISMQPTTCTNKIKKQIHCKLSAPRLLKKTKNRAISKPEPPVHAITAPSEGARKPRPAGGSRAARKTINPT